MKVLYCRSKLICAYRLMIGIFLTQTLAVPAQQNPLANSAVTPTIGAFITPVDATASSSQEGAGRTPRRLIDGSSWDETFPGSGVWVHSSNVYENGASMWNGEGNAWLTFDLGRAFSVNGVYIWNYNERAGWNSRSVKDVEILSSTDGQQFQLVGIFSLQMASGEDDDKGQTVTFKAPVRARYWKFQVQSNYRGGEMSGLAEVRFANAEEKYFKPTPQLWKPKYARPQHPELKLGQPLKGAENIVFPPDAGIVDVTRAPYLAKGDGVADDTAAIQKALDDHPNRGAIIYLPNGVYKVSDTLKWPAGDSGPGDDMKHTIMQGQSRAGTVIKLNDNNPSYQNARKRKAVIWTGQAPAQRFGNEIQNLTVDTGINNAGACGIQFIANNHGGVYNVTVQSGDGKGAIGFDMGYTDEQGPCLIKNLKVLGFDTGVYTATGVASETLEHITVQHQNKAGFRNDGQPCTVRGLRSLNEVPAFVASSGFSVLVDADLQGTGAAKSQPAIIVESAFMGRNIKTRGYATAVLNRTSSKRDVTGPNIEQFLSKPAVSLTGTAGDGLRLPVRETPEVLWDDLKHWISPLAFGAKTDDTQDDSDAIQRAIDAGQTTVYLPRGSYQIGKTITIRGNVRRIIGCKAWLNLADSLRAQNVPVFRFAEGAQPVVVLEGINTDYSSGPFCFIENSATRILVLRRLGINFQGAEAYRGNSRGTVFLEDVVGRYFRFKNQTVWARQFNPEGDGTHIVNDGGTMWILGLKTEGYGTLLETKNGGRSEVLGGLCYTVGDERQEPMFVVDNAQASVSMVEINFTGKPFETIVRETHNGDTRVLSASDAQWGRHFTLFTSTRR